MARFYILIVLAIIGIAGYYLWRRISLGKQKSESLEKSAIKNSLVFLLNEPRPFNEESLARCLDQAFSGGADDETKILGSLPTLDMKGGEGFLPLSFWHEGRMYLMSISSEPYFEDNKEDRSKISDRRLVTAIEEHRAWISVDLIGDVKDEKEREITYSVIGALMAEMAGPDIVAIYSPELSRCNEWDPRLIEVLRSGNLLDLFEEPTNTPVIDVDGDSPEMKAAVQEAKERWQEFVTAFEESNSLEDPFLVKAGFREGEIEEFMWFSPVRLAGDSVTGTLENSPHQLLDIHMGDEVIVPVNDICDWIYKGPDGEPVGGFTAKVIGRL